MLDGGWVRVYQYAFTEHVVVLRGELWPAEHEATQQVHSRLPHQSRLVHEPVLHRTLHVGLGGVGGGVSQTGRG